MAEPGRKGLSRRDFAKGAALIGAGGLLGPAAPAVAAGRGRHGEGRGPGGDEPPGDLILVNGKFVDHRGVVASRLTIRDGRIADVGHTRRVGPGARRIDLKGRTVVPGLVDSHAHFIRMGLNPGHEARLIETATSIADLQSILAARAAEVPGGDFVTCIGGWNRLGLAEQRLPTQAELDAAAPRNPVYLSQTGGGAPGGVTNSAGQRFFTAHGVAVGADGTIAGTGAALAALQSVQTDEDKARSTAEAMDFASGLGLTMVHDAGGNPRGLGAYQYAYALWQAGRLNVRLRPFLFSGEDTGYGIAETRILNSYNRLGDDVWRVPGVGERINVSTTDPGFVDACRFVAANGWSLTQHSLSVAENVFHLSAYQAANAVTPIAPLRWSLAHLNSAPDAVIDGLVAMDTGATVQGWQYTGASGGPRLKDMLEKGLRMGGGTDGTNVGPINPWLMLSYFTTGRNNAGQVINPGQSISRLDALRLYTVGSAYFSFDDDKVGTIENGKLADLVVLSDDYLRVSDDRLRKMSSLLTLQAGKVVHASGPFARYI